MTPEQVAERVATLATIARELSAPEVSLGHSDRGPGAAGELARLRDASRRVTIFRHRAVADPYVIEVVSVERDGLPVRAQWERPAEPEQIAYLDQQVEQGAVHGGDGFVACVLPDELAGGQT